MEGRSEKKRGRDGPVAVYSPRSDLTRSDSDPDSPQPKRARLDSDLESSEVMMIQENLLNILDDSDAVADRDPAIQGLDSVIRSFEEEILVSASQPEDLDLVFSHTELGFLLGASDDELGLPPSFRSSEDERRECTAELPETSSGEFGFSDSLLLQSELPNYDSFEFGICSQSDLSNSNDVISTEFLAFGGLFDNAYAVDSGR